MYLGAVFSQRKLSPKGYLARKRTTQVHLLLYYMYDKIVHRISLTKTLVSKLFFETIAPSNINLYGGRVTCRYFERGQLF